MRHLASLVRRAFHSWVWADVLVPFVVTRSLLLSVALIALKVMPLTTEHGVWDGSKQPWVNVFSRWDAGFYLSIVRDGYQYTPGQLSNAAFTPLLPALMRALAQLVGRNDTEAWLIAGIVAANVALVVALVYLVRLVRLDFDTATASRASLYLLVFPTTLFLSAVYTESLFLAGAVPAFYYARRGRWWLAGGFSVVAALSRPHGVLLVIPLAFEYLASRQFRLRAVQPDILATGLPLLGFGVWAYTLYTRFGDSLVFLKASAEWDRQFRWPWEMLRQFFSAPLVVHGNDHSILDLAFTIVIVALVIATWFTLRPSYALFATVFCVVMLSSGMLISVMRYGLTLFPIFIVLARLGRRPWFDRAYLVWGAGLACLFMAMFALWYWVA